MSILGIGRAGGASGVDEPAAVTQGAGAAPAEATSAAAVLRGGAAARPRVEAAPPRPRDDAWLRLEGLILSAVPRSLRTGPAREAVASRAETLADAVLRADDHLEAHGHYRDDDVRAVNDAADALNAIDPNFTLSDIDRPRREKLPALLFDTANLFARLRGRAAHEGKWLGDRWTSWNREVEAVPARFATPAPPAGARTREARLAPIADLVRTSTALRVVGGGHSFNASPSTGGTARQPSGTMLSLDRYDRAERVPPAEAAALYGLDGDRAERVVRVEGGKRLRDLTKQMWSEGLALPFAGSTDAQSIGGLIASDLHGTGREHAYLSQRLLEVTVVRADGSLVAFRRDAEGWATDETPPQRFDLLPVAGALGTLGVVVDATLELDPAYNLEKKTTYVDRATAERDIDSILADNDHVSFYYPGGVRDAQTVRMHTWNRTPEEPRWSAPLTRLAYEVRDHAAAAYVPDVLNEIGEREVGHPLIKALNASEPEVLPAPAAFARRLFFTHDEIEYGLPRSAYPEALDRLMDLLADEELETVVEVRFAPDTDTGLIGPGAAGRGQGGTVFLELATSKGTYSEARIAAVYEKFDRLMREYDGIPHLGKKTSMDEADLAAVHGERWSDFQALRRAWDPEGRFVPKENAFLTKLFEG